MNKEFNLSEKIETANLDMEVWEEFDFLDVEDVKEFIRLLKEELDDRIRSNTANEICNEIIDKLAGEKLK